MLFYRKQRLCHYAAADMVIFFAFRAFQHSRHRHALCQIACRTACVLIARGAGSVFFGMRRWESDSERRSCARQCFVPVNAPVSSRFYRSGGSINALRAIDKAVLKSQCVPNRGFMHVLFSSIGPDATPEQMAIQKLSALSVRTFPLTPRIGTAPASGRSSGSPSSSTDAFPCAFLRTVASCRFRLAHSSGGLHRLVCPYHLIPLHVES